MRTFFFPFRKKNLILKKYWWHRLLMVSFILAVIGSGFIMFDIENKHDREPRDTCFSIVSAELFAPNSQISFEESRVEDAKCIAAYPWHPFRNLTEGLIMAIIVSYGLQLIYFKIIYYVIFGKYHDSKI